MASKKAEAATPATQTNMEQPVLLGRDTAPVTRGNAPAGPTVRVRENGSIQLNKAASDAVGGEKIKFAVPYLLPQSRRILLVFSEAVTPEQAPAAYPVTFYAKANSLQIAAGSLFKRKGVEYDFKASGVQVFTPQIDKQTLGFGPVPKGSLTPRPVTPRAPRKATSQTAPAVPPTAPEVTIPTIPATPVFTMVPVSQ